MVFSRTRHPAADLVDQNDWLENRALPLPKPRLELSISITASKTLDYHSSLGGTTFGFSYYGILLLLILATIITTALIILACLVRLIATV